MSLQNLETPEYKKLMKEHVLAMVEYMFNTNQEFGIACEISAVYFEPILPNDLLESLPEVTLFMLANYSFDSATVDENMVTFEAGFGNENFGSMVHVPLLAIKQLLVDEYPILINIASPKEDFIEEVEEQSIDSMSALLNNPENAKLLKKKSTKS